MFAGQPQAAVPLRREEMGAGSRPPRQKSRLRENRGTPHLPAAPPRPTLGRFYSARRAGIHKPVPMGYTTMPISGVETPPPDVLSSESPCLRIGLGDRPFEVTTPDDLQLRTRHELWRKEDLINLCVRRLLIRRDHRWRFPHDADGMAEEAIHQLQRHPFVQLHSNLIYLSACDRSHRMMPSFDWNRLNRRPRRRADRDRPGAVVGMLDACICGSGDWHMAFGLAGRSSGSRELKSTQPNHAAAIRAWQERAKSVRMDIGCIDHPALRHRHGTLENRGYGSSVSILVDNAYDPLADGVR